MPRKPKDKTNTIDIVKDEEIKKVKKVSASKNSTSKKITSNESSESPKKELPKKKASSTKKSTIDVAKKSSNTSKKEVSKKTKSTKVATKTKATASEKKSTTKKKVEILEYYDLPYRYNQTTVKLLAQTPTSLFVYWDISDDDRKEFASKYGENFFNETKPILLIHNETMNYTFEIEINDFANCWYLHINDAKCVYNIELGRKYINYIPNTVTSDYVYITSSNKMDSPNDHILFNNLNNTVYFKNVKTNQIEEKRISSISSIQNIEKIYNVYDLYKQIYPEENITNFDINNPSSSFKI